MVSKNKILEFILQNVSNLAGDWQEDLELLNVWQDIYPMYFSAGISEDRYHANIVLAYTILAYDNQSDWLEPHKDRYENKVKIITRLAGLSAMTVTLFALIVENKHKEAFDLSNWYLNYQRDWRWKDVITAMEYHSMASTMSNKGALDAQEAVQIGKMLQEAKKVRETADETLNKLRVEFLSLDTALEKENRVKLSDVDNLNFMSFETYRKNNPAA